MVDGKKALVELRDENKDYDLVLLDLYMPEMDGFELLSLMYEDEKLSLIPVVVMSADGDKEIIANCLSNINRFYKKLYRNGSQRLPCKTYKILRMQGSSKTYEHC